MPSLNATPGICRGCISSRCPLIHDTGFYRGSTASEAVMLLCLTFLRNSFPSVIQWDANPVWCFLAVRDVWVGFWLHSVRFSHQSECSCASLDLHKRFCEPALAWCLCQAVLLFLWWHNRKHFWAVLHSGFSVSMFSCHRRCPGTRDTPPLTRPDAGRTGEEPPPYCSAKEPPGLYADAVGEIEAPTFCLQGVNSLHCLALRCETRSGLVPWTLWFSSPLHPLHFLGPQPPPNCAACRGPTPPPTHTLHYLRTNGMVGNRTVSTLFSALASMERKQEMVRWPCSAPLLETMSKFRSLSICCLRPHSRCVCVCVVLFERPTALFEAFDGWFLLKLSSGKCQRENCRVYFSAWQLLCSGRLLLWN